tara:strand:+ start:1961 stop:2131 length:171 start_codon:yes stop_codon:yes gene_type:complete
MRIIEIEGKFYRRAKKHEYWDEIAWYSPDGFNNIKVKLVRIDVIDPEVTRLKYEDS